MANFYLDISAIGNEYQAYTDTPTTWGIPQDGNGKAGPGSSPAVAIATIDCTSAQGDGSQTLSILGVTVSDASAGSGATLAASLVTSINGTATATIATYCQALLPLNKLIFARQNPGAMAQVQVMLRIAGADWNAIAPTHAGFTTGPTITAFTGGINGPFAYLINPVAVFGKSALSYGLFSLTKSPSSTDISGTDTIYIRTARSSVDLSVSYTLNNTYTINYQPATTLRNYVFDDGTIWSGENGQLRLSLGHTGGGSGVALSHSGTCSTYISSLGTGKNFHVLLNGTTLVSTANITNGAINSVFSFQGVEFEESETTHAFGGFVVRSVASGQTIAFVDVAIKARGSRTLASFESGSGGSRISYDRSVFEYSGLTSNVSGIFGASSYGTTSLEVTSCKFYDANGVYSITNPVVAGGASTSCRYTFTNNDGLKNVASGWAANANGTSQFTVEHFNTGRDFRQEEKSWLTEWIDNGTFPTLSAILPNGRLWSIKVLLRTTLSWAYPGRPIKINAFYRAATAYATLGISILSQAALSKSMYGILVSYIDENDVPRFETTLLSKGVYDYGSAGVHGAGGTWAMNGVSGYSSYLISTTTAYRVKQNTDLIVQLIVRGVFATDTTIYINPDVAIS